MSSWLEQGVLARAGRRVTGPAADKPQAQRMHARHEPWRASDDIALDRLNEGWGLAHPGEMGFVAVMQELQVFRGKLRWNKI